MPLFVRLSNLVIDKRAVAAKYPGGVEQFRTDFNIAGDNYDQEDNELFGLAAMSLGGLRLEGLSAAACGTTDLLPGDLTHALNVPAKSLSRTSRDHGRKSFDR